MNLLWILLQEHAEETPNVFSLSTSVSFWTVVIFLLLMAVLSKWAFPPILGYAAAARFSSPAPAAGRIV
jgi:hypothetical protein